jgi:hypothetical protein
LPNKKALKANDNKKLSSIKHIYPVLFSFNRVSHVSFDQSTLARKRHKTMNSRTKIQWEPIVVTLNYDKDVKQLSKIWFEPMPSNSEMVLEPIERKLVNVGPPARSRTFSDYFLDKCPSTPFNSCSRLFQWRPSYLALGILCAFDLRFGLHYERTA